MSTVAVTAVIEASAVDVWELLTDLPVRADWLCTVSAAELLTSGPFGPGTAWRETRTRPDGGDQAEEFLVLAAEPPHRLVLASPGIGVDYRITWTLRAVRRRRRACTAVTVEHRALPTAPSGRVMALLFGGLAARTVEGAIRHDLTALAATVRTTGRATAA
ncbi:SRPBCC family protein [Micromonospora sp. HUAS LYJ1]|uniref:SRPBCC family protein n=1 Tax=Micromonospora sp. HUAS LYJ1 TaxID=3061626 RepID=UPI0026714A9A|nr:SRPBCC family protein [Micromonospora sp. HUAS LYJ1]WKU02746.1 SRPBCC family protein [Micromonospora sp. HUAS LYJ1]